MVDVVTRPRTLELSEDLKLKFLVWSDERAAGNGDGVENPAGVFPGIVGELESADPWTPTIDCDTHTACNCPTSWDCFTNDCQTAPGGQPGCGGHENIRR